MLGNTSYKRKIGKKTYDIKDLKSWKKWKNWGFGQRVGSGVYMLGRFFSRTEGFELKKNCESFYWKKKFKFSKCRQTLPTPGFFSPKSPFSGSFQRENCQWVVGRQRHPSRWKGGKTIRQFGNFAVTLASTKHYLSNSLIRLKMPNRKTWPFYNYINTLATI